jgi:hypothetical protein
MADAEGLPASSAPVWKPAMNDFKTLLWHLDTSATGGQRLPLVQGLARSLDARLEVLYAVMPLPMQFPFAMSAESGAAGQLAACEGQARKTAQAAFAQARAEGIKSGAAGDAGAEGPAWQESLDEPVRALCRAAWAADLLVLNQPDPRAEIPSGVPADFVAAVLVDTGKPGLVLPYIALGPTIGKTVVVAWKATRESARALTAALPLLQRARQVDVVAWDETERALVAEYYQRVFGKDLPESVVGKS